jgi:hypothetical protein
VGSCSNRQPGENDRFWRDIPKIRATRRERLQFFADHAMALANETGE